MAEAKRRGYGEDGIYFDHRADCRDSAYHKLPEIAVEALRGQKRRQAEERARAGDQWQEHGLVFTTSVGRRLSRIICGESSGRSRRSPGSGRGGC